MDFHLIEQAQVNICKQYGQQFLPCSGDSIMGVALQTLGRRPLHGLRHKPKGDANGWYIWAGEYSSAADFFTPLHAMHMLDRAPEIINYLGLQPGCRFLLAEEYADVWFDAALLMA